MTETHRTTRALLIEAGLAELINYGYANFSTRRVAKACGVSCATPYKHFADTDTFITEILHHINDVYTREVEAELTPHMGEPPEDQLIALSMAYIHFAVEHPDYFNIGVTIPKDHPAAIYGFNVRFQNLVNRLTEEYFDQRHMDEESRKRSIFLSRSIVYTATLLFTNGQMEYNEENRKMIRELLFREGIL